jgi:hypothetical protein
MRASTLQNKFSHPSLIIYFFATPPNKQNWGQQIRWGITNSKPPGPIIMMDQSETLSRCEIILFVTPFFAGAPQAVQ